MSSGACLAVARRCITERRLLRCSVVVCVGGLWVGFRGRLDLRFVGLVVGRRGLGVLSEVRSALIVSSLV